MSQRLKDLAESKGAFDQVEKDWNRGTEAPPEMNDSLTLAEFEKQHKELDEIRDILDKQEFYNAFRKVK